MDEKFNYIITIHNQEQLIGQVLEGIAACVSSRSVVYTVLDGCTDGSESVVDAFRASGRMSIVKILTPDVHELRSLNAALERVSSGFVVCVQDDVVLRDSALEVKVKSLYRQEGPTLGIVSPRHAMNVRRAPFHRQLRLSGLTPLVDECDRVCGPSEPGSVPSRVNFASVVYRMVAGGSPLIIPETVWRSIGWFDEAMAPYMWADHDYSIRALKAGFRNAVYPLDFVSQPEWGGMRKSASPSFKREFEAVVLRNRRYIWRQHGHFIQSYGRGDT